MYQIWVFHMDEQKKFQFVCLVEICLLKHCNDLVKESRWCGSRINSGCGSVSDSEIKK